MKCCQFSTIFRPDAGTLDDNRACFCVTWLFLKIFETSIYKWLLQLDDYKSLHRKWLFDQTSIVPGTYTYNIYIYLELPLDNNFCFFRRIGLFVV